MEEVIASPSGDQGVMLDGGHKILSKICPISKVKTKADQTLIRKCIKIAKTKITIIA